MLLELHDRLRDPARLQATRVVVYDDFANPVALILQLGPNHVRVCHAGEPDFLAQLEAHGIKQTILVSRQDLARLPPLPIRKR